MERFRALISRSKLGAALLGRECHHPIEYTTETATAVSLLAMLSCYHSVSPERIYNSSSMCTAASNLMSAGFRYSLQMHNVAPQPNEFLTDAYLRHTDEVMANVREAGGRVFSQKELLLAERRLFPHENIAVDSAGPSETWFITFHRLGDYNEFLEKTSNIRGLLPFPLEYFCAGCEQNTEHVHAIMTARFPGNMEWMRRVIEQRLHLYGFPGAKFSISPLQKPTRASLLYIYRQSVGRIIHWTARDIIPTLEKKRNFLGTYSLAPGVLPRSENTISAVEDGCTPALVTIYDPVAFDGYKGEMRRNRECYSNFSYEVPMIVAPVSQRMTLMQSMMRRLPGNTPGLFIHSHTEDRSNAERYQLQPFAANYIQSDDPRRVLEEARRFAECEEYAGTASKILFVDDEMISGVEWPDGISVVENPESIYQTVNYLFDSL
jgi:hypothetical protein